MKYTIVPLLFFILFNSMVIAQPRRSKPLSEEKQQQQIIYVPVPVNPQTIKPQELDPHEKEQQQNQQLFNNFIYILGSFGKILLNPNDTPNVTANVANMINGIINVAQTVTRTHRSPAGLNKIVAAFIKYIQQQKQQKKQMRSRFI